jgi:hypothetical protein
MLKEVMGQAGLSTYTILAMFVAIAAAVGVVVFLFVLRRREDFRRAQGLPFDNGVRVDSRPEDRIGVPGNGGGHG